MAFFNLTNHPFATWSAAQQQAAVALGHGALVELPQGVPLVDPLLDASAVVQQAETLAAQVVAAGAKGAAVMGDFSFSFALVQALKARGVRCYATTSERKVQEHIAANGETIKSAVFRFVRFREYL
ncbi:MAG: CRISPR-associated protein [Proteobacteria bacterium]|nr:CRISPR-associated protein [Pseudomonadota bacterium]